MNEVNKETYQKMIFKDLQEISKYMPEHSLEKKHIVSVLRGALIRFIMFPCKVLPCRQRKKQLQRKNIIFFGEPSAQMRHRSFKRGKFSGTYDPSVDKKNDFLSVVQERAPAAPITDPIDLSIIFYFGRPKSHYGSGIKSTILKDNAPVFCAGKKDLDNCVKFATDAMNHVFYKDDAQIVRVFSEKRYAERPRTEIIITTL